MVEIIIKRKMAKAIGLDKKTFAAGRGEDILTEDPSSGDFSIDTKARNKTYFDSLNESRQTQFLERCLREFKSSGERKSFEEIMEEEMKG